MRILIMTQIYLPEMGALSNRLYPLVSELAARGHEVSIATGMPNYPSGKVFDGFRGRLAMTEQTGDCRIWRTHYYTVPRNRSKIAQVLSYLTFMPAVLASGLRAGRCDALLITSPPLFPVIPAILLAKLFGAKLVYDVRDLWSDELVTYGDMTDADRAVRIARKIENWGYRQADLINVTTDALGETVAQRGAAREKIFFLPNGADLELFKPLPARNPIADEFDFGKRFVVMYSGLFGIKHGLETFLETAEILRAHRDICFFMIGNGARRRELEEYVAEKKLENVLIAGERRVEDIPHIIARADACFAAVRPEPYPRKLISVKIFEYLACEKPVIGAVEGESARIIEQSNGGFVVAPGDAQAVAAAILKLRENARLRQKMGKSGRRFVESHYSRRTWAQRFEQRLQSLSADAPQRETAADRPTEIGADAVR